MNAQFAPLFELSPTEKLQLVQDLWDSLADHPENVPVPDWLKTELDRRKAAYLQNPESAMTWEEAKESIRRANG